MRLKNERKAKHCIWPFARIYFWKSRWVTYAKILTLLLIAPALCRANIIKIGFTGLVDQVDDPCNLLENGVHQNDLITGYYTYDSETPDSFPQYSDQGVYRHLTAFYGMSLTISSLTFQTDSTDPTNEEFEVDIWNKSNYDLYSVTSGHNIPLNDEVTVDGIGLSLQDLSGAAISSIELPLTPPDLFVWQYKDLSISGAMYPFPTDGSKPIFDISGHVTDIWLIPEPSTLFLLGLGVLLLGKRR